MRMGKKLYHRHYALALVGLSIILAVCLSRGRMVTAQEMTPVEREKLGEAERAADLFVERFRQTLDFGTVWREFHSSNPRCAYEASGSFHAGQIEELKLSDAFIERLYISSRNFYYLKFAYGLSVARIYPESALREEDIFPKELWKAERKAAKFEEKEDVPRTAASFESICRNYEQLARICRKYMPGDVMQTAAWRANNDWLVSRGGGIVHLGISKGETGCVPAKATVYIADRGIFYFYFVEENGRMKVVGLGMIDSV